MKNNAPRLPRNSQRHESCLKISVLFLSSLLILLPKIGFALPAKDSGKFDVLLKEAKEEEAHCRKIQAKAQEQTLILEKSKYKDKKSFEALLELSRQNPPRGLKNTEAWDSLISGLRKNPKFLEHIDQIQPICAGFSVNFNLVTIVFEKAPLEFSSNDKSLVAQVGKDLIRAVVDAQNPTLFESLFTISSAAALSKSGYLAPSKYSELEKLNQRGEAKRASFAREHQESKKSLESLLEEVKAAKALTSELRPIVGQLK